MADVLTSTQTREPGKTVLRTMLQTAIAVFPLLLLVVPEVIDIILAEIGKSGVILPDWTMAALVGTATACTVISGALARIMAIPAVNAFLARFKLGAGLKDPVIDAAPQNALDENNDGLPDFA